MGAGVSVPHSLVCLSGLEKADTRFTGLLPLITCNSESQ